MNFREAKALTIAEHIQPTRHGKTWYVPSQTGNKVYIVDPHPENPSCTCEDHLLRKNRCKHILAVDFVLKGVPQDLNTVEPRPTYKQDWPAYNLAQTTEKEKFQELLAELCRDVEDFPQELGRPRLSLGEMIFACAFKVYSGFSGRRFSTDLREAHAKGYLSKACHFNSIFNYLEMKMLTPVLKELIQRSSLPLRAVERNFAVDSSGFGTPNYHEWRSVKYGQLRTARNWVKMHLICGVKTNIVTAVEISGKDNADSPFFKPLLVTTANNGFTTTEVSGDKAYSSRDNLRLVAEQGGTPYIAFKENTTGKKGNDTWRRMFHFYSLHRDEFLEHYHQRSNVESTFWMIKSKFGERIRSKTDDAQINEALCKVLCHNICCIIQSMYELGVEAAFCAKTEAAQKVLLLHKNSP